MTAVTRSDLAERCRAALARVGVADRDARILADATAEAEAFGNRATGVAHLFDYLDGFTRGRITLTSQPEVRRVAPAMIDADAAGGLAQTAFTDAFGELLEATRAAGLGALWIRNSFTCGELGYYARRFAAEGFLAVASANSPALMSLGGAPKPILGTNPLAYAIPRPGRWPVVIDQASSSTAFVNVRRAAEAGQPIPVGWALGPDGTETQDAALALQGTLLPFGGYRGGNIALLVETLATLSGATFSMDAAPFDRGTDSPGIGVFLLGIDATNFPGALDRLSEQFDSLTTNHRVSIPAFQAAGPRESLDIPDDVLERLQDAGRIR